MASIGMHSHFVREKKRRRIQNRQRYASEWVTASILRMTHCDSNEVHVKSTAFIWIVVPSILNCFRLGSTPSTKCFRNYKYCSRRRGRKKKTITESKSNSIVSVCAGFASSFTNSAAREWCTFRPDIYYFSHLMRVDETRWYWVKVQYAVTHSVSSHLAFRRVYDVINKQIARASIEQSSYK